MGEGGGDSCKLSSDLHLHAVPHTYGIALALSHAFRLVGFCLLGKLGSSRKHKQSHFIHKRREEKVGYQATQDSHGQVKRQGQQKPGSARDERGHL